MVSKTCKMEFPLRNRLCTACKMEFRPRNRLCTAYEMEFRPRNGLCTTCEMEFRLRNRLCTTCKMEFRTRNGLCTTCKMEFRPRNSILHVLEAMQTTHFHPPPLISPLFSTNFSREKCDWSEKMEALPRFGGLAERPSTFVSDLRTDKK